MNELPELNRRLERALGSSWQIRALAETGSTMEDAKAFARDRRGIALALAQKTGRGRQGREWRSPSGGFYATFAIPLMVPASSCAGLSLAVGVWIYESLSIPPSNGRLKWPNDLYTPDGRKIGGVLIELNGSEDDLVAMIGIGMNLLPLPDLPDESGSLAELVDRPLDIEDVAAAIAPAIVDGADKFCRSGFSGIKSRWLDRAFGLGRILEIDSGSGVFSGRFTGVDDTGALILDDTTRVVSGHVLGFSEE